MKHDYTGFPKKGPMPNIDLVKECPQCEGHGGWYVSEYLDVSCSHCNGYGFVREDNNCPGHKLVHVRSLGRCLNLYKCSVCGAEQQIDSSD